MINEPINNNNDLLTYGTGEAILVKVNKIALDVNFFSKRFEYSTKVHYSKIDSLENKVDELNERMGKVETGLEEVKTEVKTLGDRVEKVETGLEEVKTEVKTLGNKLNKLDEKFEDKFNKLDEKFEDKFNQLEEKFDNKFNKLFDLLASSKKI